MTVTINGTTGASFPDGSAGTPAEKGSTSSTAGIFYPAANTVAISTNSAEALRVDSSQNVGIGTSSPSQKLHVYGNLLCDSASSTNIYVQSAGTTYTQFLTTSSATTLKTVTANPLILGTNDTERARIDSSGRFLMPAANLFDGVTMMQLDASAAARAALGIKAGTNNYCQTFFAYNNSSLGGSITTSGTTTTFGTSSDYRLKENVQPMYGALSRIAELKPVTYNWKADNSLGEGFIAHELQTVIPLSVIGEKDAITEDGNIAPQQVDYAKLTPILTAAIQELSAKLDAAEARIAALEAK